MNRSSRLRAPRARIVPPGQRIMRSIVAVWLCMLVYVIRGMNGEPFYSIIAALQCVQPYSSNMISEGRERIIGTLIGAFWGSVILFAELLPVGGSFRTTVIFYLLLGVFSGLVIYSTVLMGIPQYALFAAVVFLGIAMYHVEDVNPYIHVYYRTIETIIGVGVAIAINSVHFPRIYDRSTLFVSGIDSVLFREDRKLTPFTKVELNRFLDEGMRFSVQTKQTPATVREILSDINLKLPIIAMDGAVLYDLHTMKYVRTEKMDPELVTHVSGFLHEQGYPFFVNTIQDNLLVIYFKDYKNLILDEVKDAHHEAVHHYKQEEHAPTIKKRVSPYRNYVRTNAAITHDVIYILVIDQEEKVDQLHASLMEQPWASQCRTNFDTFDCEEGEKLMRIYASGSTRSEMLKHMQQYVGAPQTITFGNDPGECDVLIEDAGRDRMVKELKKRFSPIDLRGWRNIIHM